MEEPLHILYSCVAIVGVSTDISISVGVSTVVCVIVCLFTYPRPCGKYVDYVNLCAYLALSRKIV